MRKFLLVAMVLGLLLPVTTRGQVVINEFMQSNIDCVFVRNDFPDSWVELYNPGPRYYPLADFKIGITDNPDQAWQLPADRFIWAGDHYLVYCDKEAHDRHTDFRLDSAKDGAIYLFYKGEIIDKVENIKKQPAPNIAFGRTDDGADEWGYMSVPTPGAANCGTTVTEILGEPVFSVKGMVTDRPLTLTVSLPKKAPDGTVVRYTTDGSEPTPASAIFTEPLQIDTTTIVRATAFCEGYLSPRSTAHSYIFLGRDMTLPVLSLQTDSTYFFDETIGLYTDPTYWTDVRRPINVEYFEAPNTPAIINQLGETRIKGGATRTLPLKSLILYANKRFGEKRYVHEFFPSDAPGITQFKSFEIRNAGNDFYGLYFRDMLMQKSIGSYADLDWQPGRPVIFMLNGKYMGIMNLRPRSNEDHTYAFYDGLEDIDMFENWSECKVGDDIALDNFVDFYSNDIKSLNELDKWMNVDEYTNALIASLYFDNTDYMSNNIVMWRPRTGDDTRWRWITKDMDSGINLNRNPNKNTIEHFMSETPPGPVDANTWEYATRLYRTLMNNSEYADKFVDKCLVFTADFLNADHIVPLMHAMDSTIRRELPYHHALYQTEAYDRDEYIADVESWIGARTDYFLGHVHKQFSLGDYVPLAIDPNREDTDLHLAVSGIGLHSRSFDGVWPAGRRLRVNVLRCDPADPFVKWEVKIHNGTHSTTYTTYATQLDIDMPSADSVTINTLRHEYIASVDGVVTADSVIDADSPIEVFNLTGRHVMTAPTLGEINNALAAGIYILRQGTATAKHLVR